MEVPRATVVGGPRRAPAIVAVAIIAAAIALVWRMVEAERRGPDQLMSAASAATRSTE